MAKPVAAVTTSNDWIVVVCDDGSTWARHGTNWDGKWEKGSPVPGTAAADPTKFDADV